MTSNDGCSADETAATKRPYYHAFDFFLFVNPVAPNCLAFERSLLDFLEQTDYTIHFHLVCSHDYQSLKRELQSQGTARSVADFNRLFDANYRLTLAYNAAACQCPRRAFRFLLDLQERWHAQDELFDPDELQPLLEKHRFDYPMWREDFDSPRVREDYKNDNRLMRQMGVSQFPTLVVFDSANEQYGLKLKAPFDCELLPLLLDKIAAKSERLQQEKQQQPKLRLADNR